MIIGIIAFSEMAVLTDRRRNREARASTERCAAALLGSETIIFDRWMDCGRGSRKASDKFES